MTLKLVVRKRPDTVEAYLLPTLESNAGYVERELKSLARFCTWLELALEEGEVTIELASLQIISLHSSIPEKALFMPTKGMVLLNSNGEVVLSSSNHPLCGRFGCKRLKAGAWYRIPSAAHSKPNKGAARVKFIPTRRCCRVGECQNLQTICVGQLCIVMIPVEVIT